MNAMTDTYRLVNGVEIPCVGFGTWQVQEGPEAVAIVREALDAGYRHIDTAANYGNEASVGKAVRESGLPRESLFITSKLQNPMHGYENTVQAFEESMQKLGMDYLDLYLIHWPNPVKYRHEWQQANAGTWRAFEEFYRAGRIRAIGVSNFLPHHLDELAKSATIFPMVNQIRLCPGSVDEEAIAYCRARNMLLEAYSPMGTGKIFAVPEMAAMAQKYGRTIAQLCIRWSLQMGFLPLPKSSTPARIRENADVFGFTLSAEDMKAVSALTNCCGETRNPDTITF